jgi:hypothetical protein
MIPWDNPQQTVAGIEAFLAKLGVAR